MVAPSIPFWGGLLHIQRLRHAQCCCWYSLEGVYPRSPFLSALDNLRCLGVPRKNLSQDEYTGFYFQLSNLLRMPGNFVLLGVVVLIGISHLRHCLAEHG